MSAPPGPPPAAHGYPWTVPAAASLHEMLYQAFPLPNAIDLAYKQAGGTRPLTLGLAANLIWAEVLGWLAVDGLLCGFLDDLSSRGGPLGETATSVRAALTPTAGTGMVGNGLVSLDRDELRSRLTLLARPDGLVRTIVVRGEPQSGKSWSSYVFQDCAREHGGVPVHLSGGEIADLRGVLEELFLAARAMPSDIPSRPDTTTPVAWYQQVWRELRGHVQRGARPLWIAVDDLGVDEDGAPLLDPEIRMFFDTLAATFMNPAPREWFRLMLIHYPGTSVPTRWRIEHWREERTSVADVRAEHVVTQLREWTTAHGLRLPDDHIARAAQDIVGAAEGPVPAGTDPRCRLQRINDGLRAMLEGLEKAPS